MRCICFLVVVLLVSATVKGDEGVEGVITGGTTATVGQFKYIASIVFRYADGTKFCTGSLINTEWVVTAGHCTLDAYSATVGVGGRDIGNPAEPGRVTLGSSVIITHPQFSRTILAYDIGVLKLNQPLVLTNLIQPIALANENAVVGSGVPVRLIGWGRTSSSSNTLSNLLQYGDLKTVPNTVCASYYTDEVARNSTICCGSSATVTACPGDYGGPVITYDNSDLQVGIISFGGPTGCSPGRPGQFTRISSFRPWIRTTTGV